MNGPKKAHLIAFEMTLRGSTTPLRVLLDPGATDNFVSEDALKRFNIFNHSTVIPSHDIIVRLATGIRVRTKKRTIELTLSVGSFTQSDEFTVLKLDEQFDALLGICWCARYEPNIDWKHQRILSLCGDRFDLKGKIKYLNRSVITEYVSRLESDGPKLDTNMFNTNSTEAIGDGDGSTKCLKSHERLKGNDTVDVSCLRTIEIVPNTGKENFILQTHRDDDGISVNDTLTREASHKDDTLRTFGISLKDGIKKKHLTQESSLLNKRQFNCPTDMDLLADSVTDHDIVSEHPFADGVTHSDIVSEIYPLADGVTRSDIASEHMGICVINENVDMQHSQIGKNPPSTAKELIQLPAMSYKTLMNNLRRNTIEQICLVAIRDDEEIDKNHSSIEGSFLGTSSTMDPDVLPEKTKVQRFQ